MAILKSVDGKVYNVPDDKLEDFELPEEVLADLGKQMQDRPGEGAPASEQKEMASPAGKCQNADDGSAEAREAENDASTS